MTKSVHAKASADPEQTNVDIQPNDPRLEITSILAPVIRSMRKRKVKVYSKETGETVGEVDLADVAQAAGKLVILEFGVDEGVRPDKVKCIACGRIFKPADRNGPASNFCQKCEVPMPCAGFGSLPCPGKRQLSLREATRNARGKPVRFTDWRCKSCSVNHRRGHDGTPVYCAGNGVDVCPTNELMPRRKMFKLREINRQGRSYRCRPCAIRNAVRDRAPEHTAAIGRKIRATFLERYSAAERTKIAAQVWKKRRAREPEKGLLPCTICGVPSTKKSTVQARSTNRTKPYCEDHRGGVRTHRARVPCGVCGIPSTERSSNAAYRAVKAGKERKAYCTDHPYGREKS